MKQDKKYAVIVKAIRDELSIKELEKIIELAKDVIANRIDGGYKE